MIHVSTPQTISKFLVRPLVEKVIALRTHDSTEKKNLPTTIAITCEDQYICFSFFISSAPQVFVQHFGTDLGGYHLVCGYQNRNRTYGVHSRKIILDSTPTATRPP